MSESRGFLPKLLNVPGRTVQRLMGSPPPVPCDHVTMSEVADAARRSPRANGFLSVDDSLTAFSCDHGLLTYAVSGRTAFVVGGPHAGLDNEHAEELLSTFRDRAAKVGYRRILLFPVLSQNRENARRAQFDTIKAGVEAYVDLDQFTLAGKDFADLRQMRNRAVKRYSIEVSELDPSSSDCRTSMSRVYERWVEASRAGHKMRLVVGLPAFDAPQGRRYFGARGSDGMLLAFTTLVPCFGGNGWGVDVMAQLPAAPAGTMDLLLSEAAIAVREEGANVFSLGSCPMAETANTDGRHPLLSWTFRFLYTSSVGNRLFNFRSLHRYKMKFNPRWEPVHFAVWPRVTAQALYVGCGMWGLFGEPWRSERGALGTDERTALPE